jgi:hypothetical protein
MPVLLQMPIRTRGNPQTIYIRAEDTNGLCCLYDGMVTLDLIMKSVPLMSPSALGSAMMIRTAYKHLLCWRDNNADGPRAIPMLALAIMRHY